MSSPVKQPLLLSEAQVVALLPWGPLINVVEQAMYSITNTTDETRTTAHQPTRAITHVPENNGLLFSMPAFVRNFAIDGKTCNSLACKLVTSFSKNQARKQPLPNILGNVFLFNDTTGELECIMGGNELTARRTAAASVVATKILCNSKKTSFDVLAILGPGVQGRSHAKALFEILHFKKIHVWNRSDSCATCIQQLREELPHAKIIDFPTNEEAVKDADVIVTATYASSPIVELEWVKPDVHINAIGAGENHHSELSPALYKEAQVYVDTLEGAKVELAGLAEYDCPVLGEIGELLLEKKQPPTCGITVYHNMGMAVLDAVSARLVMNNYKPKKTSQKECHECRKKKDSCKKPLKEKH